MLDNTKMDENQIVNTFDHVLRISTKSEQSIDIDRSISLRFDELEKSLDERTKSDRPSSQRFDEFGNSSESRPNSAKFSIDEKTNSTSIKRTQNRRRSVGSKSIKITEDMGTSLLRRCNDNENPNKSIDIISMSNKSDHNSLSDPSILSNYSFQEIDELSLTQVKTNQKVSIEEFNKMEDIKKPNENNNQILLNEISIEPNLTFHYHEPTPLFEHFLIVGAPPELATQLALKIRFQEEKKEAASRYMKRLGNMFSSNTKPNSLSRHQSGIIAAAVTSDIIPPSSSNKCPNSLPSSGETSTYQISDSSKTSSTTLPLAVKVSTDSNKRSSPLSTSFLSKTSQMLSKFTFSASSPSGSTPPASSPSHPRTQTPISAMPTAALNTIDVPTPVVKTTVVSTDSSVPASTAGPAPTLFPLSTDAPSSSDLNTANKFFVTDTNCQDGGYALCPAGMLYRYPQQARPPPAEVCDFCLPLGGRIDRIGAKDDDRKIENILYRETKRSAKCFIFTLDDRISSNVSQCDEELGLDTDKLYGICVMHPRLLKAVVPATSSTESNISTKLHEDFEYDFESCVCYAFVTRFPLFDFFFQVLYDMITAERLARMDLITERSMSGKFLECDVAKEREIYSYLPRFTLEEILDRLTVLQPPKYHKLLSFQTVPSMSPIIFTRSKPTENNSEHDIASSEWALPVLLSWIPIETLIWAIGLLMCEVKIIVVGSEPGMVSCGVVGLLAMLRPLSWVAPLIPILPMKHLDFIESPVPIVAGVVVVGTHDSDASSKQRFFTAKAYISAAHQMLAQCNDADSGGTLSAVLDVSDRELYVSGCGAMALRELKLPGAERLVEKLRECLAPHCKDKGKAASKIPTYQVSLLQQHEVIAVQDILEKHIQSMCEMAKSSYEKNQREELVKRQQGFVASVRQKRDCMSSLDSRSGLALPPTTAADGTTQAVIQASNCTTAMTSTSHSSQATTTNLLQFEEDIISSDSLLESLQTDSLLPTSILIPCDTVSDHSSVPQDTDIGLLSYGSTDRYSLSQLPLLAPSRSSLSVASSTSDSSQNSPSHSIASFAGSSISTKTILSSPSSKSDTIHSTTTSSPGLKKMNSYIGSFLNAGDEQFEEIQKVTSLVNPENINAFQRDGLNSVLSLTKERLYDGDTDAFFKRFIATQMFAEVLEVGNGQSSSIGWEDRSDKRSDVEDSLYVPNDQDSSADEEEDVNDSMVWSTEVLDLLNSSNSNSLMTSNKTTAYITNSMKLSVNLDAKMPVTTNPQEIPKPSKESSATGARSQSVRITSLIGQTIGISPMQLPALSSMSFFKASAPSDSPTQISKTFQILSSEKSSTKNAVKETSSLGEKTPADEYFKLPDNCNY